MREKYRYEHPMDRIKRMNADRRYGTLKTIKFRFVDNGFEYSRYKNGRYFFIENPVTWLVRCEHCGTSSTPKKVQYRPCTGFYVGKTNDIQTYFKSQTLCMGCWNQMRPIIKSLDAINELAVLARSTKRKLDEATKINARTA